MRYGFSEPPPLIRLNFGEFFGGNQQVSQENISITTGLQNNMVEP